MRLRRHREDCEFVSKYLYICMFTLHTQRSIRSYLQSYNRVTHLSLHPPSQIQHLRPIHSKPHSSKFDKMATDPSTTTALPPTPATSAPAQKSNSGNESTQYTPAPAPTGASLTANHAATESLRGIVEKSKDSGDEQLVVREVVPGIVTFSIPFVSCSCT